MTRHCTISLEPESGKRVEIRVADEGGILTQVLFAHGYSLNTRCGQRGLCRGC